MNVSRVERSNGRIEIGLRQRAYEKLWTLPLPGSIVQIMRRVLKRRVVSRSRFQVEVEDKVGLEIGGPSGVFGNAGELPIYRHVAALDNCVFSTETIWEGKRLEGRSFSYQPDKHKGFNFIREATE